MLIEQIKADLDAARKEHDKFTLGLLTTLYSDIQMLGKNALRDTTDLEALSIVKKFIKGIDDTILLLTTCPTHDKLRNKLLQEKDKLNKYIPQQLDEVALTTIIKQYIDVGITTMPLMMKALKDNYPGQYDGSLASKLVKDNLK